MNPFPRFSMLTPVEWAILIWFLASILFALWIRVQRKVPLAAAVYQGMLR